MARPAQVGEELKIHVETGRKTEKAKSSLEYE